MRTVAIPQPQPDKLAHFFWGALVSLSGHGIEFVLRHLGVHLPRGLMGMACCGLVALGREAWNATHGGRWSWADIGWTVAGGASASGPYALT